MAQLHHLFTLSGFLLPALCAPQLQTSLQKFSAKTWQVTCVRLWRF